MKLKQFLAQSGMIVVFVLVLIAAVVIAPRFLSMPNMISLGLNVSATGMIACTMLLCLAAGDFDMSVGSILGLGGMVAVIIANETGSLLLGTIGALLAGALFGLLNGFVIAKCGINAFITTLASMQIVRGLVNILGHGAAVMATPAEFALFEHETFLGISLPIWVMIGAFLIFGIVLNKTVFGRNTLAIGGNKEAAHLAGIKVARTKIVLFVLSGMVAALAGVITASRLAMASNLAGEGIEFKAISACVLGGVSLSGGVATMSGAIVGVLIMGIVENVMRLLGVDAFYQLIVTGVILLLAVLLDRAKMKWLKAA